MDHKTSLDKYTAARLRAAGGPMVSGGSLEDSIAAPKEIYLQPIDQLKAEIEKRGGSSSVSPIMTIWDWVRISAFARPRRTPP